MWQADRGVRKDPKSFPPADPRCRGFSEFLTCKMRECLKRSTLRLKAWKRGVSQRAVLGEKKKEKKLVVAVKAFFEKCAARDEKLWRDYP